MIDTNRILQILKIIFSILNIRKTIHVQLVYEYTKRVEYNFVHAICLVYISLKKHVFNKNVGEEKRAYIF